MSLPPELPERGPLEVETVTDANTLVVRFRGQLDIAGRDIVRATLDGVDALGVHVALVDLDELTFCDVSGVRELIHVHNVLSERVGTVTFRHLTPQVHWVVHLTQADLVLHLETPRTND